MPTKGEGRISEEVAVAEVWYGVIKISLWPGEIFSTVTTTTPEIDTSHFLEFNSHHRYSFPFVLLPSHRLTILSQHSLIFIFSRAAGGCARYRA